VVEKVDVYALYCAQGMTNWIEYFANKTDTVPSMMAIVDLGGKGTDSDTAPKFIASRLKSFPTTNRRIRVAVISHQDNDHWLLIDPFLSEISGAGVTIDKVYKGGQYWGSQAINAVDRLAAGTGTTASYLPNHCSDYDGHDSEIAKQGTCRIRVIIANAPCTDNGSGMKPNGTSAMIAVELGGKSVVLPGDATYETMNFADPIFKRSDGPKPCYGLSLPHHGSLRTSVKGYARHKDVADMDLSFVRTFRENLKAEQMVASSGPENGHKHPIEEIVKEFEKYCVAPITKHYIQVFNFDAYIWDEPTRSTPVWTTSGFKEVTDSSGKVWLEWDLRSYYFTLESTGVTTMTQINHRTLTTPAPPAMTVAPPPGEDELAAHAVRSGDAAL